MFLDPLAHHLTAVLRRDNRPANEVGRIRLRQAVHTGMVLLDPHGVTGHALVHAFRLLEAAAFKRAAAQANTDLALIVSDQTYTDATAYGGLVNPGAYQALRINCKETRSRAWTWFPTQANARSR